jgi:hypothetical protein
MSRGVGFLLALAGLGLFLDDESGREASIARTVGLMCLVAGSGLLLGYPDEDRA